MVSRSRQMTLPLPSIWWSSSRQQIVLVFGASSRMWPHLTPTPSWWPFRRPTRLYWWTLPGMCISFRNTSLPQLAIRPSFSPTTRWVPVLSLWLDTSQTWQCTTRIRTTGRPAGWRSTRSASQSTKTIRPCSWHYQRVMSIGLATSRQRSSRTSLRKIQHTTVSSWMPSISTQFA